MSTVWMITSECPPLSTGGVGTHVLELGLEALGHAVVVFTPVKNAAQLQLDSRSILYVCPVPKLSLLWGSERLLAERHAVLKGSPHFPETGTAPDFLHCHDWHLYPPCGAASSSHRMSSHHHVLHYTGCRPLLGGQPHLCSTLW